MQLHEEGDQDQEASHSSCLGSRHLIRLCWWERTPSCLPCKDEDVVQTSKGNQTFAFMTGDTVEVFLKPEAKSAV